MSFRDLFLTKDNQVTNTMETYVASVNTETGVSPTIIAAILAFIGQMISMCPKPPTPAALIAGGGVMGEIVLNRAVREVAGLRPRSEEGQKLVASMKTNAAHLSEADAGLFLTMSTAV